MSLSSYILNTLLHNAPHLVNEIPSVAAGGATPPFMPQPQQSQAVPMASPAVSPTTSAQGPNPLPAPAAPPAPQPSSPPPAAPAPPGSPASNLEAMQRQMELNRANEKTRGGIDQLMSAHAQPDLPPPAKAPIITPTNPQLPSDEMPSLPAPAPPTPEGYRAGKGDRIKKALLTALTGALQGIAANPQNPLGGGIGGAAAGGLLEAISPATSDAYRYERNVRPAILRKEAEEHERAQRQGEITKVGQEARKRDADIRRVDQEIRESDARTKTILAPPQKVPLILKPGEMAKMPDGSVIYGLDTPDKMINVPPGATVYDTRTNKPVYTAPDRQRPAETDKEAEIEQDASVDIEAEVQQRFEARRPEIIKSLPKQYQEMLEKGTANGKPAYPEDVQRALAALEQKEQRELERIRKSVESAQKKATASQKLKHRDGGRQQPSGKQPKNQPSGNTKSLSELKGLLK